MICGMCLLTKTFQTGILPKRVSVLQLLRLCCILVVNAVDVFIRLVIHVVAVVLFRLGVRVWWDLSLAHHGLVV